MFCDCCGIWKPWIVTWPGDAIVQLLVYLPVCLYFKIVFLDSSLPPKMILLFGLFSSFKNSNGNITYLKTNSSSLPAKKNPKKTKTKNGVTVTSFWWS